MAVEWMGSPYGNVLLSLFRPQWKLWPDKTLHKPKQNLWTLAHRVFQLVTTDISANTVTGFKWNWWKRPFIFYHVGLMELQLWTMFYSGLAETPG